MRALMRALRRVRTLMRPRRFERELDEELSFHLEMQTRWHESQGLDRVTAHTLAAREFDPTLPGLFAGDPPAEFAPLMRAMAADVRPESLRTALDVMAEADQRDLLPRIAVPTLLIWGELDARSPLSAAHEFERAISDTALVVIPDAGHVSNLERPDLFNDAIRGFCR